MVPNTDDINRHLVTSRALCESHISLSIQRTHGNITSSTCRVSLLWCLSDMQVDNWSTRSAVITYNPSDSKVLIWQNPVPLVSDVIRPWYQQEQSLWQQALVWHDKTILPSLHNSMQYYSLTVIRDDILLPELLCSLKFSSKKFSENMANTTHTTLGAEVCIHKEMPIM